MTTSGCGPGDLSNPKNRTRLETQAALLPTPRASVNENRQTKRTPSQEAGTHGKNLAAEVCELLPTPRASDGAKGGPNQRGSSGDLTLPSAAVRLLPTPRASDTGTPGRRASDGFRPPLSQVILPLLPTPTASNPNDGEDLENWEARRQRNLAKGTNGNGQGTPLSVAMRLLPTPTAQAHSRNRTANRHDPKGSTNAQGSTLLDAFWTGDHTDPPSPDGNTS